MPPDWFVKADDRLLEYLSIEGAATPKKITKDDRIDIPRSYINQRLLLLKKSGFVETRIGRGVYEVTKEGKEYLSGESDFRDLEKPN